VPQATFTVTNFSLTSTWVVSQYPIGHPQEYTRYISSGPTIGASEQTFSLSGILAGSTINSAVLTATLGSPLTGAAIQSVAIEGGSNYTFNGSLDVTSAVAASFGDGDNTISANFRFKATGNASSVGNRSSVLSFSDVTLTIDYTLPYTKCKAPTTVTVSPTSTGKSKTASLSWSGAAGGTNNAITGYDVYRSTTSSTSGFTLLSSPTASPINVTSSATNGGKIYYKVVAKGAAGASYYSDMSSAVATLTSTWTNATAPNSVTGPTNVVMNTAQKISWSGAAGGTNNPISKYQVFYSGDNYAAVLVETTNTYVNVTSHVTNGSSYTYKVKVVAEQNSVLSTASHTMKSLVGNITPPSSISFDANNLAPGGQTAIRWSGQAGGTNNKIVSYDIQTSPDNATWTFVANTTNTAYSPATASATNNATVYYRVKLKGERIDAYSSSIGLVTKVTKPKPPSTIALNDGGLPVGWSTDKTLSWSGASAGDYNNAIYGYRVMVSDNGGALAQYGSDLITSNTYGSITVTSRTTNGTQKFYVHTIGATTIAAEKLSAQSTAYKILTTTVTNPTAPTASIPTNVAPGSTQSLSWSGAVDGTNNAITTYKIYEKVDSGSWVSVGPDGTSPFTVTAHASNGGKKSYYIVADGPHGDSPASNTVVMTTTVSKPNAPTAVSLSATSNLAPNADVTLSWSGASNGTYNNPVNGYRVMRAIDTGAYTKLEADLPKTTTSLVVKTKNGNGTHSFRVIALGTNLDIHSDMSSKIATATTVVSTPAAPSVVEVVNGGGVAPQSVRLLRWSGAAAGTYNNPIKGYQVYRSTSATTGYTAFGSPILDPDTYYEMNVEAPTSDGAAYYYKVVTLGNTLSINSAMSSVYGTLTTQKLPSTGKLNKTSLTATGAETITVTISPQLTTYSHKVTWYINGTYTSGAITKAAGTITDTYTVPQNWILATTPTTTSVVAKCKVETFDGTTSLGFNEYNFTVNVPGKSAFTLTGVPLTTTGSASATATIASKYSGYKHTVVWSTTGYSQTHNVAAGTATQAYAIPKAWCNSAPNATSFTVTVTVTTIKVAGGGDMSLGSNTTTFTANVPSDVVPSITSFTPTGVDQKWSLYVRTKSKVKWTPVAAGSYSSTIVSYKVENANLNSGVLTYSTGASWTSGALNHSGTQTFTLTVTDSRGRTASTSGNITVTNYNAPSIASAAFVRATSNGTIDRTAGTYVNLTAAFVYSNIGTNAITAKAYYKEVGTATWLPSGGTAVTITGTAPNMLGSVTYGAGALLISKLYDVKVALTDAYSTVEVLNIVPTVTRVFDFREGRAAFGGIAAINNSLQVPAGWTMHVNGNKEVFHDGRTVPIANGGTGATNAATARTNLGITLGNLGVTATAAELNYVDGVTSAIQTQLNGKAATSHGNHVPTTQTANNAVYLRNDNTWQTITAAKIGAAASSHDHTQLYAKTDNRSVATAPNDYNNYFTVAGLKQSSTVGTPMTGTYVGIIGWRQWSDSSGGPATELAFGDEGIAFRQGATTSWGGWNRLIHSGNYNSYAPTKTGTGASGTWGISITGNAASATKLATARTLTIGSTGKTFNGTGNVSWSLAEIGAAASSHTHSYVPINDTLGGVYVSRNAGGIAGSVTGSNGVGAIRLDLGTANQMLNARITIRSYNYLATIVIGGYTYVSTTAWHMPQAYGLIDGGDLKVRFCSSGTSRYITIGDTNTGWSGYPFVTIDELNSGYANTHLQNIPVSLVTAYPGTVDKTITIPGGVNITSNNYNSYAPSKTGTGASGSWGISITGSSASCTGNAATATKAATLTTARTLTIGSTGKTFNGSANVSWTLAEIGAAAASHTHSYAPLTGAGTSGTWGISITGNAATASNSSKLGGLSLGNATAGSHPGANVVVRTDANGYLNVGWINTVSGTATGTPTRIYCSQDAYLRYYAPDNATLRRSMKAYITYGTSLPTSGMATGDFFIKI